MVDLAIDNPTDEPLVVSIDSLVVEVPPKEVAWVEMGKGKHTITLANDSVVEYNFDQAMYMLNPSLISYLKFEQLYGNANSISSQMSIIPYDTVHYLGMELIGNYAVVQDLVNPITWDYGPREPLPEMVELDASTGSTTLVKIMDPWELSEEIEASNQGREEESGSAPE